jgi:hypothetical protein
MHKNLGDKLNMGPVWDLNIGYGDPRLPVNDWIINYNTHVPDDPWLVPFWWNRFMSDPQFVSLLKTRWESLRRNELAFNTIKELIENTSNYLIENGAVERNYTKWSGIEVNYENEIDIMIQYLENRLIWMDSKINAM